MNVQRFSKEIIKIGNTFVALSTIYAIEGIQLYGSRGFGQQCYGFNVKTCLGQDGNVGVTGSEIPYYKLEEKELTWGKEDEHPIYADKKIELLVVRDEVVEIWDKYLEENK